MITSSEVQSWLASPCYSIVEAAALTVGFSPSAVKEGPDNVFDIQLDWQAKNDAIMLRNFLNAGKAKELEELIEPSFEQEQTYKIASADFKARLVVLFRAVMAGKLPAAKNYEPEVLSPDVAQGEYQRYRVTETRTYLYKGAPNLETTTIDKEDLIVWLEANGLTNNIFFSKPEQKAAASEVPEYLNPANECYSPKLAAAVQAWMAVTENPPGTREALAAIKAWLNRNIKMFKNKKGSYLASGASEEIAVVVNWTYQRGEKDDNK
jgi:hypothetical protein